MIHVVWLLTSFWATPSSLLNENWWGQGYIITLTMWYYCIIILLTNNSEMLQELKGIYKKIYTQQY